MERNYIKDNILGKTRYEMMEQIHNYTKINVIEPAKYKIVELTMNPMIRSYLMKQQIVITLLLAVIILRLYFNCIKESHSDTKKQRSESRKAWRNTCDL